MKPRKIRRRSSGYRRSRFRQRSQWPKILGIVAALAVVVVAGFFAGKLLFGGYTPETEQPDTPGTTTSSTTGNSTTQSTTGTTQTPKPTGLPTLGSVKAVYVTTASLKNTEALGTTLQNAKQAGFTGIVFDLKDATGKVQFAATGAYTKEAKSMVDSPLTKAQLQAVLTLCKEEEMLAIPRLYAFLDRTASRAMTSARIHYKGQPETGWLDNARDKGGKPWLNPYSPQAHEYLIGLGAELHEWGFDAIIYDGVQFPNQDLSKAGFGDSAYTSMSKLEVLQTFVKSLKNALPDCEVSICATGLGTIGESTAIYGGNPLSFGSTYLSPLLYPSALGKSLTVGEQKLTNLTADPAGTVTAAYRLVGDRIKLMTTTAPKLLPWLETAGYTSAQIKAELAALGNSPFVLYDANGTYDFESLK